VLTVAYDRGSLTVTAPPGEPPGPAEAWVWDERIGAFRGLALEYRALVRRLTRQGRAFKDRARAYPELPPPPQPLPPPFPHQAAALGAWSRAKRGMVELPTGAGKTRLALMAAADVRRGTLVLAPTLDLVAQWAEEVRRYLGIEAAMIGGGSFDIGPVTIATYASAARHGPEFGDRFCLAVFDECHHVAGEMFSQCAEVLIAPYRLGLSATVERPDGRHRLLDRLIGPLVYRQTISELSGRYLADYETRVLHTEFTPEEAEEYRAARETYRAFLNEHGLAMDGVESWQRFVYTATRTAAGRDALSAFYRQRRLSFAAQAKFEMLAELLRRHRQERVLIFTNDNRTAYDISRRFLLPLITHQTKLAERKAWLAGFREGRWPFLVTSKVLNEGVDVPAASVAVIVSGSASVREHVQRLGRILRKDGAKRAVLYELLTRGTTELGTSERRRRHDAYR
jgi:superfamily II DNA or RNA helicase